MILCSAIIVIKPCRERKRERRGTVEGMLAQHALIKHECNEEMYQRILGSGAITDSKMHPFLFSLEENNLASVSINM